MSIILLANSASTSAAEPLNNTTIDEANYIPVPLNYSYMIANSSTSGDTISAAVGVDGNWAYYRDITISNTGNALTGYQVLITLGGSNFTSNATPDGRDIRFTDQDGNGLSYWIESWDYTGRSARIWVTVTEIPASGSTTIGMYYGNPGAASASNGKRTFAVFDDFGGTVINSSLWATEVVNSAALYQTGGGELVMAVGKTQQGNRAHLNSKGGYPVPYRLRFKAKLSGYNDDFTHSFDGTSDLAGNPPPHVLYGQNAMLYRLDNGGGSDVAVAMANSSTRSTSITTGTANVYSIFEILATASDVKFVVDGALKAAYVNGIPAIPLRLYFRLVTEGNAPWVPGGATQWMDYAFLAKYASPEPAVAIGPETSAEVITHKVAYIPVKYADRLEPIFTIDELNQRAKKVTDYYKQQSFGKVNIGYTFFGNGNWITLDKTFSYFGSPAFKDYLGWDKIREYAINFSGINASQYDAVMVIQPENVRAYTAMETGKIVMYQYRAFSTWAHELGHALFKFNDYYPDVSIFGIPLKGGDVRYWDLMGTGDKMNPAAPLMSYNKLSAGWLNQTFIGYGEYPVQLLSEMSFGDDVKTYKKSYFESYIFEGRYPPDGMAMDPDAALMPDFYPSDKLKKDEGILLYFNSFGKLFTVPHDKTGKDNVTLIPGESYRDDLAQAEFLAKKRDSQLYIDIQPATIIGRKVISLLNVTAEILSSGISAEAPLVNASEDYDLHVHTYDGGHVGMNYTTGEYEIGIENATTSGNIPGGGPEWISLPDNVKVFYTIDATPARQWAKELNVTLENVTATWQVVGYDENGTRNASEPAILNVSLEEPTSIGIAAGVDIQPDTLNLKSGGKWITAYVELPKGYDAAKIDIGTVRLNYAVPAETNPKYGFVKNPEITDRDGNGIPELMVKFDRSAVQKLIGQAVGTVELIVTGEVADNNGVLMPFRGSDRVKILGV